MDQELTLMLGIIYKSFHMTKVAFEIWEEIGD